MPFRGKLKVEGLIFCIENDIELSRAQTLLTKEEGTIRWLDRIQPGDVFFDIGANIGCYTLYAAKRGAKVYAFEPHCGNAHKLLMNVEANGFRDLVTVITAPLHSEDCWLPFNYSSKAPGSSGSQLGHVRDEYGKTFTPSAVEMKMTLRLDSIVLPCPRWMKVDVDGNEKEVLEGARDYLAKCDSIQIETRREAGRGSGLDDYMSRFGFYLWGRHHTSLGKKQIAAGADPLAIPHNAIFEQVPVNA